MNIENSTKNSHQSKQEDETKFTETLHTWEKEVERDLMLLLQTWHADGAIKKNISEEKTDITKLLDQHSKYFQQPVYFPFGAKTEAALGDAIAKANGLILIECKRKLDTADWTREALPEKIIASEEEGGKKEVINKGGKDRKAQLERVSEKLIEEFNYNAKEIADQCHVLIAPFSKAKGSGPAALRFTFYWDFIIGNEIEKCVIKATELNELKNLFVPFDEFYNYVLAMIQARNGNESITQSPENRFIFLAKDNNTWKGYKTSAQALPLILNLAYNAVKNPDNKAGSKKLAGGGKPKK